VDKEYLKVVFEGGMYRNGGSVVLIMPKELLNYLDIQYDENGKPLTKLKLIGDLNKHQMPFVGLWNPEQQEKLKQKTKA
jgi:hypothetical protein